MAVQFLSSSEIVDYGRQRSMVQKPKSIPVNFLVIAGGGGGATYNGGFTGSAGAGAGGYRNSHGTSGGNSSAETALEIKNIVNSLTFYKSIGTNTKIPPVMKDRFN